MWPFKKKVGALDVYIRENNSLILKHADNLDTMRHLGMLRQVNKPLDGYSWQEIKESVLKDDIIYDIAIKRYK